MRENMVYEKYMNGTTSEEPPVIERMLHWVPENHGAAVGDAY